MSVSSRKKKHTPQTYSLEQSGLGPLCFFHPSVKQPVRDCTVTLLLRHARDVPVPVPAERAWKRGARRVSKRLKVRVDEPRVPSRVSIAILVV